MNDEKLEQIKEDEMKSMPTFRILCQQCGREIKKTSLTKNGGLVIAYVLACETCASHKIACCYCHGIFDVSKMYSVDACCAEHQELLQEVRPTSRAVDVASPCAHRYHAEDDNNLICIDCGATTPRN